MRNRQTLPSNSEDVSIRKYWPLVVSSILAVTTVLVLVGLSLPLTDGTFSYPLDDTYIHLAIAKRLVTEGTWGINSGQFSSASSSILWPVLIGAGFLLAGEAVLVPLLLSLTCMILAIWTAFAYLTRFPGMEPSRALVVLLSVVYLSGIPATALTGMEHTLHIFSTIGLVGFASFSQNRTSSPSIFLLLVLFSALVTASRFEGLFTVGVVAALMLLKRQFRMTLALLGGGFLPVCVFGAVSVANGAMFLPNSVLLKTTSLNLDSARDIFNILGGKGLTRLLTLDPPWLSSLFGIALLILAWNVSRNRRSVLSDPRSFVLVTFLLVSVAHLNFAQTGFFFRYETYLMALGLLGSLSVVLEADAKSEPRSILPKVLLWCVILPLSTSILARAAVSLYVAPRAMANIYEQQMQMAGFLGQYYPGQSVALNDIGAVSFLSGVNVVDLVGIGDNRVARMRRNGQRPVLETIVESMGARVVAVSEDWVREQSGGALPSGWHKVGTWKIEQNIVCTSDTVSWFAPSQGEAEVLEQNLRSYSAQLPGGVLARFTNSGGYAEEVQSARQKREELFVDPIHSPLATIAVFKLENREYILGKDMLEGMGLKSRHARILRQGDRVILEAVDGEIREVPEGWSAHGTDWEAGLGKQVSRTVWQVNTPYQMGDSPLVLSLQIHPAGPVIRVVDSGLVKPDSFQGLKYFPVDEGFRVKGTIRPQPVREIKMIDTKGWERTGYVYGQVNFELEGRSEQLDLLLFDASPTPESRYLLIFQDATSGNESYPACRYLYLPFQKDGEIWIDFNLSFNPYCNYGEGFACPLPLPGNRLKVAIRAGEKMYR